MASAVDDDGPYTYDGVEKRFIKRAEKELNEKPAQTTDSCCASFAWPSSTRAAQMLLDNYLTIRKSPKGTPSWFDYPSVDSPEVKEYLSHPFHVFLGHTSEGEGVYVSNMGYWDQQKMTFEQLIRCMYMSVDAAQMDQYSQINGIKILVDMNQANRNQMSFFENRKNFFSLMRNWQDAFPVRIRTVIYVNEPAFFDVIFTLIKNAPFLKEKFKKKLHKVGKDYARLRKVIGEQDADRLLPKELGGSNGTLQELMEWTRNNFGSERMHREWRLQRQEMEVDESKRLPTTKDYLRTEDSAADATTDVRPYDYEGVEPQFIRRAEKELNEKPSQLPAHIASLRRWLSSMPHLRCRT
uniref:CRAL-TRIO domain-containing protein n=1 Tax=Macrostomum lignano TaxID=282301 RepID=A0A1I8IBV5_9PLAT